MYVYKNVRQLALLPQIFLKFVNQLVQTIHTMKMEPAKINAKLDMRMMFWELVPLLVLLTTMQIH